MVAYRVVSTLLACGLVAASLAAQLPKFGETIDVRVINVDAVVTGPNGIPVRGLGVEEFELLVNGKPVPIAYFASVEDGQAAVPQAGSIVSERPPETGEAAKPYLAVVWDQRALRPKDAKRVLEHLLEDLPRLIESSRGILIARQGTSLGIEQSFTHDPALLEEALSRIGKRTVISSARGERSLLFSQLERAPRPEEATTTEEAELVQIMAERLLREINMQARQEELEARGSVSQLRQLVNLLSNLPGRKCVLYFSSGVQTRPAEAVYRLWWDKYRSIAPRLSIPGIQSQLDQTEISSRFLRLTTEANGNRVAFYAHDVGGSRPTAASVQYATLEAVTLSADESIGQQQTLLALANNTGGLGTLNVSSLKPLLDDMLRDFRSYYSLGFEASDAIPDRGRIEVRVRHPDLDIRHFDRFERTPPSDDLERAAMTALITDEASNPLEVSIEVGESERQKNGTFLVPILVKVPISRLALLPRENRHVGQLSVVVMAQSADGDFSAPAHGEVPIEIDNAELLAAMNRLAGYRLRMQVSPGEQTITIGLRDDVARTLSTLNLALNTNRGS